VHAIKTSICVWELHTEDGRCLQAIVFSAACAPGALNAEAGRLLANICSRTGGVAGSAGGELLQGPRTAPAAGREHLFFAGCSFHQLGGAPAGLVHKNQATDGTLIDNMLLHVAREK